jgi:hypothetical protein
MEVKTRHREPKVIWQVEDADFEDGGDVTAEPRLEVDGIETQAEVIS